MMGKRPMNAERWLLLFVVLCAPFLAVLDGFIFNLAIPTIQTELHGNNASAQLIVVGYTFAYATLLVTGGRLGDIYGRRRLFILGMASFTIASLLGAMAFNTTSLVVVRVLQGVAAAMMYPQALSLIQVNFTGGARARALGAFGVALGMASIIGQVFGGVLIHWNLLHLSWRPIFLVNVPLGVVAVLLAVRLFKESRAETTPRLDVGGVASLSISLFFLVFFLVMGRQLGWPMWMWVLPVVSILTGSLFIWYEKRLAAQERLPLVHLDLLKLRPFVAGLILTFVFYVGQGSFFLLLTLFLQYGLRLSSLAAGLTFTPIAIGFFLASIAAARLTARLGKYILTVGSGISACGVAWLSFLALSGQAETAAYTLLLAFFVIGIGYGLVIPSLIGVVLHSVPKHHSGSASGVLITVQQIASAIGIAVIGIPFFNALGNIHPDYISALGHTLYYTTGLFAATALLTRFLKDYPERATHASD